MLFRSTQPHEEPAGVPDDHSDMPMEGMPMDGSEPHVDPPGTPPHDDGDASGAGMKMDEAKPHPHAPGTPAHDDQAASRSEEHTSELQSLMRNSYAVFCLNKKKTT